MLFKTHNCFKAVLNEKPLDWKAIERKNSLDLKIAPIIYRQMRPLLLLFYIFNLTEISAQKYLDDIC